MTRWILFGTYLLKKTYEGHYTIAITDDIAQQMATLKDRLGALDRERSQIADQLGLLERAQSEETVRPPPQLTASVTMTSSAAEKTALFRSLFRGRDDVFRPAHSTSSRTTKRLGRAAERATAVRSRHQIATWWAHEAELAGELVQGDLSESRLHWLLLSFGPQNIHNAGRSIDPSGRRFITRHPDSRWPYPDKV